MAKTDTLKRQEDWLTPNFNINEFHCHDGTPVPASLVPNAQKLAENLEVIRATIKEPIHINSAYRTPSYNSKVGGVKRSYHLSCSAADFSSKAYSPKRLGAILKDLIAKKRITAGGVGIYPGFVHYDIRGKLVEWWG